MILGLFGKIASGKDTVADYLVRKYSFVKITMSDIIKIELKKRNLEVSRDNLRKVSLEMKEKFGRDIWAKKCVEYINSKNIERAVISGIRDSEEVKYFRKFPNFYLVEVIANPKLRYERLLNRGDVKDRIKDFEEFLEEDKKEEELFDVFSLKADYVIYNDGTLEELYSSVDALLNNLL